MPKSKSDKLFDKLETAIEKLLNKAERKGITYDDVLDVTDLARKAELARMSERVAEMAEIYA